MYDDDNTEHRFFCYADTEKEAVQRFCVATDLKRLVLFLCMCYNQNMKNVVNGNYKERK